MKFPFSNPIQDASGVADVAANVGGAAGNAAKETASMFGNLWSDISGSMGPQLGEAIPRLFGALIILVVGYIIARIIRWIVTNVINRTGVGTKLSNMMGTQSSGSADVGSGFGIGAFWIIMMFVAIACLKALGLDSVSAPLNDLLSQFFGFIPKILGAAAVGAVAFLVATLAKIGTQKGMMLGNVDSRLKLADGTLTNTIPMAIFCFIILFFLPAILGALQMDELSGPVQDMVQKILGFLPNLLSAGIIMAIFFLIAKLVGTLVTNLLQPTGFNKLPQSLGLMSADTKLPADPSSLAGKAAMGVIMLLGLSQSVEMLKLEVVSNFFKEASDFAGPVVIGLLILGVGVWLANMARKAVKASSMKNADSISNVAFIGTMVLTGVIALKRMGLAGEIVDLGFGLALGGVALALGLAFGLGGRNAAAKFLDKRMN